MSNLPDDGVKIPFGFKRLSDLVWETSMADVLTDLGLGRLKSWRLHRDGLVEKIDGIQWGNLSYRLDLDLLDDIERRRWPDATRPPAEFTYIVEPTVVANEPSKNAKAGGNPGKHDWEGAYIELAKMAALDEGDVTRPRMNDRIKDWFISKTGEHPSESQIREKVARFHAALWPPKT